MKLRLALLLILALTAAACRQEMEDMPRYDPQEPSAYFGDGKAAREPVDGTVARDADLLPAPETIPQPVTLALLEHGRDRFEIFCSPCHGSAGDGQGMVVQRGFPAPPTYHQKALREAPDRHFYDVITNGYGAMYSYAARVPPTDRWAIIAYIRALQFSSYADATDLPADMIARLDAEADK